MAHVYYGTTKKPGRDRLIASSYDGYKVKKTFPITITGAVKMR